MTNVKNKTNESTTNTFSKVIIRGTVKSKLRLTNTLIFTVATLNGKTGKKDYPKFIASTNVDELDRAFTVDDRITVEAYLRTTKRYPDNTLTPLSITRERRRIDAAFAGENFHMDCNELTLRGKLKRDPVAPNATTTLATLAIDNPNGTPGQSFVKVVCFNKAAAAMKRKKGGEIVEAIGYVRTKPASELKTEHDHAQSIILVNLR